MTKTRKVCALWRDTSTDGCTCSIDAGEFIVAITDPNCPLHSTAGNPLDPWPVLQTSALKAPAA